MIMIRSWRRRIAGHHAGKHELPEGNSGMELTIPRHFRCPISLDLMKDPVTLSTGITYDRESIERWMDSGNRSCPVTNQLLETSDQIPNHAIRRMIQDWCVENKSHGIERIPTPRIPITPHDVLEACTRITTATQRGDAKKCRELVSKIKSWVKESERNKRCVLENGSTRILLATFDHLARVSMEKHDGLLRDILSTLIWIFPLHGDDECSKLSSESSLRCMLGFLKGDDLSTRQNTILALKELLSFDQKHVNSLLEIDDFPYEFFKILKVPICPTSTKASLTVIYHMVNSVAATGKLISGFVQMGLIPWILEIIVDSERSICEKVLAVLDSICGYEEGREEVVHHGLTVPVLIKKMMRVSNLATEFSVSILWKICKHAKMENGGVLLVEEALQVGGFQKILVVLQLGCGDKTKEKATELLKLMNRYRDRLDCLGSSMDFKYLKRSY